jgi:hypothetical protein
VGDRFDLESIRSRDDRQPVIAMAAFFCCQKQSPHGDGGKGNSRTVYLDTSEIASTWKASGLAMTGNQLLRWQRSLLSEAISSR